MVHCVHVERRRYRRQFEGDMSSVYRRLVTKNDTGRRCIAYRHHEYSYSHVVCDWRDCSRWSNVGAKVWNGWRWNCQHCRSPAILLGEAVDMSTTVLRYLYASCETDTCQSSGCIPKHLQVGTWRFWRTVCCCETSPCTSGHKLQTRPFLQRSILQ